MPRVYQRRGAFSDWISSFQIGKWGEKSKNASPGYKTVTVPSTCEEKRAEGRGVIPSSSRAVLIVSYSWLPFPRSIAWKKSKDAGHMRGPSSTYIIQRVDCLKRRRSVSPQRVTTVYAAALAHNLNVFLIHSCPYVTWKDLMDSANRVLFSSPSTVTSTSTSARFKTCRKISWEFGWHVAISLGERTCIRNTRK